ncbi:hypothetical protein [Skermanella pratensis]|uniref:hypothetical protein n=1 Tax=Skermanella pratensis TaxID=2233999 RepID=UPI00130118E7|nr:hypothetical protein [Skermanella pratensis]
MVDEGRNRQGLRTVLGRVAPGQEDKIKPTIAELNIAELNIAEGEAWRKLKGKAEILLRMVQGQLGTVPASVELKVKAAPVTGIGVWIDAMLDGRSLDEVFPETAH